MSYFVAAEQDWPPSESPSDLGAVPWEFCVTHIVNWKNPGIRVHNFTESLLSIFLRQETQGEFHRNMVPSTHSLASGIPTHPCMVKSANKMTANYYDD